MRSPTSNTPLERWPLRGGLPCLDFANTEAFRGTGHDVDLLDSYEMLVAWSLAAGALRPSEAGLLLRSATDKPDVAAALLAHAKELRHVTHVVLQSVAQNAEPPLAALATFNAFLAETQVQGQILKTEEGFEVRFRPEDDMALPIWRLTDSAARLLLSPERENVRECPGHECGWLFLDTTRNHSRRWCDSGDCGNRERVKAYTRRQREAALN